MDKDNEEYYRIVKPLKTYERETAELLRQKGASEVSIRLEEAKKPKPQEKPAQREKLPEQKRALVKLLIALSVFAVSISGIFIAVKMLRQDTPPPPEEIAETLLIHGEKTIDIDTTKKGKDQIRESIGESRSGLSFGTDTIILLNFIETIPVRKNLTAEEFLTRLTTTAPGYLVRALGPHISYGYYGQNGTPFLLIEVNSFGHAYAGMLEWEKTIAKDLKELINQEVSGISFDDEIIEGKDIRVLRNSQGIELIYSFLNKKTLLITSDLDTFRAILDKSSASEYN